MYIGSTQLVTCDQELKENYNWGSYLTVRWLMMKISLNNRNVRLIGSVPISSIKKMKIKETQKSNYKTKRQIKTSRKTLELTKSVPH